MVQRRLAANGRYSNHNFGQVVVNTPRWIQRKLEISEPGDQFEQEADHIAEQVTATGGIDGLLASQPSKPLSQAQTPNDPSTRSATTDTFEEGASSAEDTGPADQATASLIVEDETLEPRAEQMRKSEFMDELRAAVCAAADAELAAVGRDTQGCPYIEKWIGYYRAQSGQYIERAIRKYASEAAGTLSARDYIPLLAERVRRAVAVWADTGEITGVPEGVSAAAAMAATAEGVGKILFKARDQRARETDPQKIQAQLNAGSALDSSARSRMESAFSHDFSRVRVHTDSGSAALASSLSARAFTIGSDIAFGAGEYQPGTLVGDALLAHELAHVVQQGGAVSTAPLPKDEAQHNGLEEDADNSAVGAVVSIWGRAQGAFANIAQHAMPHLKSGLRLQRCPGNKETCLEGNKTITVDLIKLRGSSRTPATDLAEANKIYKKCCVQFTVGQDKAPPKDKSDAWLGGDTDLNATGVTCSDVTAEEKAVYDGATNEYKLSSRMRAFYVQTFSGYEARAFSRPEYCAKGTASSYANHLLVNNTAASDTLAHEFGHILLNNEDHQGIDNPSDTNNLMFAPGRTGSELDASQCKKIYNNA